MIKVNLKSDELSDEKLKIRDMGEGLVVITFERPIIPDYFTRVIPIIKRANPSLQITAIAILPSRCSQENIHMRVKEVWINFEKKVPFESNPVFGTENFMDP